MVPFNLFARAFLSELLRGEEKASLAAPNVLPFITSMQNALGTMLRLLSPLSIAKTKRKVYRGLFKFNNCTLFTGNNLVLDGIR